MSIGKVEGAATPLPSKPFRLIAEVQEISRHCSGCPSQGSEAIERMATPDRERRLVQAFKHAAKLVANVPASARHMSAIHQHAQTNRDLLP